MTKEPGLTLADIASQTKDVPVGDNFVTVRGISAKTGLAIIKRFPQLAKMTQGFSGTDLIATMPEAVSAIIAAGVGKFGDEDEELAAGDIPLETQVDILEAIGGLTFSNGFAPFVQRILRLANAAKFDSFTKVPDMKSPLASKHLSPQDTTPTKSGTTPPDKSQPSASSPKSE